METTSILAILAVIVLVYVLIKLVVSPIVKAVAGIAILLLAVYIIQQYFNVNLTDSLGDWGKYLDITKWNINLISVPEFINKIKETIWH